MEIQVHRVGERLMQHSVGPFRVDRTRYPHGFAMGLHTHETPHLSCLIGGSFSEGWGAKEFTRSQGAAIFRRAGAEHSCRFHAAPVEILRVGFAGDWLARVEDIASNESKSHVAASALTGRLIQRLCRELNSESVCGPLLAESIILELLAETLRTGETVERYEPRWLRDVRDQLHDGVPHPPSLTELAARAGVHPSHLARTFRKQYGCTVGEYARRLRVEFAMDRLRGTDESLAAIAQVAGFSDQAHFSRQFRSVTGVTPGAYRRQSQLR